MRKQGKRNEIRNLKRSLRLCLYEIARYKNKTGPIVSQLLLLKRLLKMF